MRIEHPGSRICLGVAAAMIVLAWTPGALGDPRVSELQSDARCTLEPGSTRSVVRVIDAHTVQLNDGRTVRLIGALGPHSPDLSPDADLWMPEENAVTALRALVLGQSVELAHAGRKRDRYGRMLAHLFLERDGKRVWVQGELLRNGHARAYGLPGSYACMSELLAHEHVARKAKAGIWTNAAYSIRDAKHARSLLRERNTYQIVGGEVARIKVTRSRTYLDFGGDWRKDFSVGVAPKVLRAHPKWADGLASMQGKRVEVRGWITYRYGPYIEIEDPSQLRAVEERLPGPTSPPGSATTSSEKRAVPSQKKKRPEPKPPGALDL